jgi:hypothetical protein
MLTCFPDMSGRWPVSSRWGALVLLGFVASWGIAKAQPRLEQGLGQPGYVVIEAARDSVSAFGWETGPGPGLRTLVWDEGRLTIPDSLPVEDFGRRDIGFPCTASFAGTGDSGRLVIQDGIFSVSETVLLTDGILQLEVTGGELEIRGAMIRYRRSTSVSREFKSGLLLLAGMTLMVIVLLRRFRLKSSEGTGS